MENKSTVEIDFLGLNSAKYEEERNNYIDCKCSRFVDSDKEEVETSLSLGSCSSSSSSSLDSRRELCNPHEKKTYEFSSYNPCSLVHYNIADDPKTEQTNLVFVSKPVYIPKSTSSGFTFISNDPSIDLTCLDRRKSNNRGHNPTVAMARKATLARFLEKRLHRMNQARSPLLWEDHRNMIPILKPLPQASNTCNNKKDNIIR